MISHALWANLLFCLLLFSVKVIGQEAGKNSLPTRVDSLSGISTGEVLDGIKYFIKTAPIDTALDEHMPIYKPDANKFVFVDVQPVPIKQVPAKYPDEARTARIEGTVWIKCLVGKDGKVTKPIVMKSDASVFDKAAITAVSQWIFSPARLKGKPVAVWTAIPFRFKLNRQ